MAFPPVEHKRREGIDAFGIVAPHASQRTSLEENVRPDTASIVKAESLYVENSKHNGNDPDVSL